MTATFDDREFADTYRQARDRFRAAAVSAGARLHRIPIEARGPSGESLSVDIAWLGDPHASAALLHCSGIHGVEAFAGSAIQCRALATLAAPGSGCALILAHALNPWGMAWWRRTNENNVDLNRNFRTAADPYAGAPNAYAALSGLLNPTGAPRFDGFRLRAFAALLRYGARTCREAVLGGQYTHPKGLFYGGSGLQPSAAGYARWVATNLAGLDYLLVLDVHSGLGRFAEELLLYQRDANHTPAEELAAAIGAKVQQVPSAADTAYPVSGGHGGLHARLLESTRVDFLTEEFGTYGMLRLLAILRNENRAYHHAGQHSAHWRRRLLEALTPTSPAWRRRVIEQGMERLGAGLGWVATQVRQTP